MKKVVKVLTILMLMLVCFSALICTQAISEEKNKSTERKSCSCSSSNALPKNAGPPGNDETECMSDNDSDKSNSDKKVSIDLNTIIDKVLDPPMYVVMRFIDNVFPKKENSKQGGDRSNPPNVRKGEKVIPVRKRKRRKRKARKR